MMDFETTTLLALVASFDNRKVDEARSAAWHSILREVDFEDAKRVVVAHFAHPNEYLTVSHITEGVLRMHRRLPKQIEADVRAARARGIVDSDWLENVPLAADAAARLAAARSGDREQSEQLSIGAPGGTPGELGVIVKIVS